MKIIITEEQLKKLINENATSGTITIYHRTNSNFNKFDEGFKVGKQDKFGSGLYGTYELEDLLHPSMTTYGKNIIEFTVPVTDKVLCLDKEYMFKIFGREINLIQQLKKILKGKTKKLLNKQVINNILSLYRENRYENLLRAMFGFYPYFLNFIDTLLFKTDDGLRYAVIYNLNIVNPIRYSEDNGQTWKPVRQGDKKFFNIGKDNRSINQIINNINVRKEKNVLNLNTFDIQNLTNKQKEELYYNLDKIKDDDVRKEIRNLLKFTEKNDNLKMDNLKNELNENKQSYSFTLVFNKWERKNAFLDDIRTVSTGNTTLIAKNKKVGGLYIHPTGKIVKGSFYKVAGSHSSPILWTNDKVVIEFNGFPFNPKSIETDQIDKQNNVEILNVIKN